MPLGKWDLRLAQSPFRATNQDLARLMEILSDPLEWEIFGEKRFEVILRLHKAVVQRRVPMHIGFEREVRRVGNTSGIFKPNVTRER